MCAFKRFKQNFFILDEEKSDPVALGEFEEHCRKLTESSNYGYDEQFDDLSQVGRVVGLT